MAKNKNAIASVLSFEKKLVPSDGYLYGTTWESRNEVTALTLTEKSVRGTISNREKPAVANDPLKLNAKIEKPNLQRVDSCSLLPYQDTLKLQFTLKILGGVQKPSACNNADFKQSYGVAVASYIQQHGFVELAKRYATNIANARFLWRNRVGAEYLLVQVNALNEDSKQSWEFDATQIPLRNFSYQSDDITSLSKRIADTLASEDQFLMLEVICFAKVGKAQEVYPSEELVLDKSNSKEKKSKILYSNNGIAAMHTQKIGNALRTVDTWYPEFSDPETSAGPIAIEPYGAVTNLGKAFRTPKDKQDFYSFFDAFALGEKLARVEDEHYVMATLIRGGVFGASDKE
ncbi:type I-F CRISPR-associated protein Csy3 [Glaciecola sp. SC05]|uniref:type I-F CRISPR-associated protein Csy3 n=1 Tax=Glaciecola sp. SC05 TaxID=1987355 RepID=UPI0035282300